MRRNGPALVPSIRLWMASTSAAIAMPLATTDSASRLTFGFDLSPLYCQSEEIARVAEAVHEAEDGVNPIGWTTGA